MNRSELVTEINTCHRLAAACPTFLALLAHETYRHILTTTSYQISHGFWHPKTQPIKSLTDFKRDTCSLSERGGGKDPVVGPLRRPNVLWTRDHLRPSFTTLRAPLITPFTHSGINYTIGFRNSSSRVKQHLREGGNYIKIKKAGWEQTDYFPITWKRNSKRKRDSPSIGKS